MPETICEICKKPETDCWCERCLICETVVAHTHYRVCDECIRIELNRAERECRPGVVYVNRVEPFSNYEDAGYRLMINHLAKHPPCADINNCRLTTTIQKLMFIITHHNANKQNHNLENCIERIQKEMTHPPNL